MMNQCLIVHQELDIKACKQMYQQFFLWLRCLMTRYKRAYTHHPFLDCFIVMLLCALAAESLLSFIN